MNSYLIYRHGSNAANQSMTPVAAVAIVDAASEADAIRIAGENLTCYNNQFFEAVLEADLDENQCEDWNEIGSRDAEMRAAGQGSIVFSA